MRLWPPLVLLFLTACTPTLTVMTYNIKHGRGMDGRVDLHRIAWVIRESGADLVALQEVDKGTKRTNGLDIAKELGQLCGMEHVFHKNIDFQGGEYGNAILSKLPIVDHDNHHYAMLRKGEQRGLLRVAVRFHGQTLQFFDTHIDHRKDDSERVSNLREIRERLDRAPRDELWIVCGDFNDTPGSRTHQAATAMFLDCWQAVGKGPGLTMPSDNPTRRIDYVFLRPARGRRPVRAWVPNTQASDHRPVVVELRRSPR